MDVLEAALDYESCKQDTDDIKHAKERLRLANEKEDKKAQASACYDLAWLYYEIEDYQQSKTYGQELLDISKVLNNKKQKAEAYHFLAWSYYHEGNYEESKKYGEKLLTVSKTVEDETLEASAHGVLAWSYKEDKDFTKSEKNGQEWLRISRKVMNKEHEASAYHVLTSLYYDDKNYEKCKEFGGMVLSISKELGDKELEAHAHCTLALSCYDAGDYEKSKEYGQELLSISEKLGDKKQEAQACDILAWSYYDAGDYEKSKEYGQELLRISEELGEKKKKAQAYAVLAWLYYDAGDYEKSKEHGQELLSISEELGEKKQKAQAYAVLAWSYYDAADYEKSKEYGQELLSISEELGEKKQKVQAYDVLAWSYYKGTDYEQSKTYGQKFLSISKVLRDKKKEARACDVLVMSCYKERDYEQSKTYNKELLSISKELGNKKMEAKASNFLTWLNSELEKCQQSKEYGEESLSIAKGVKDKNLKAEACGGKELPERHIFNVLQQIEQQAWEDTNKNETGLSEKFKRYAKEKGFSISDNQGEGDCMFLALAEQLHLKKGIKISQAELRQIVVQYLKKNPTLRDGTDLFQFVDGYSSWDAYLKSMMTNGTWGDHVILHGAANHFETCIQVVSSHYDDVMICPGYDDTGSTRLVLGHVLELHYVSLIPRKGASSPGNHPETKAVYKMTAIPRGMTLIINIRSFNDEVGEQLTRLGSEKDVDLLKALFGDLGFMVQTKENLTKDELMKELRDVVRQDHSSYDCFVLWLMSHGKSGGVMCSDKVTISIETLQRMFRECPTLIGKPKLFFIQACRGDEEDEGKDVVTDTDISADKQVNETNEAKKAISPEDSVNQQATKIPTNSDFLFAFSTVDRFVSYRNVCKGSYYVRCLVEVFRERVADDHLIEMLTLVNQKVSEVAVERKSSENKDGRKIYKQSPEFRNTLRKKLRF